MSLAVMLRMARRQDLHSAIKRQEDEDRAIWSKAYAAAIVKGLQADEEADLAVAAYRARNPGSKDACIRELEEMDRYAREQREAEEARRKRSWFARTFS